MEISFPIKKGFMEKEKKKKKINVMTTFFVFHKNNVKTFLIWIVNHYSQGTRYH